MCSKEEKYPLHILGIKYQIPRGDWVAGENRNAYSLEKEKLCGRSSFSQLYSDSQEKRNTSA